MPLKSEQEDNPLAAPLDDDYLQTKLNYGERFDTDDEFDAAYEAWPRCPECGRRRSTRCPVCGAQGDLFPLGDSSFWNVPSDETEPDSPTSDHCGHCGGNCGAGAPEPSTLDGQLLPGVPSASALIERGAKTSSAFDDLSEEPDRDSDEDGGPLVAVCHLCSEAFEPVFPKRCEWCDYEFSDGVDYEAEAIASSGASEEVDAFLESREEAPNEDEEANSGRVVLTIAALAAVLAGVLFYFLFLGL